MMLMGLWRVAMEMFSRYLQEPGRYLLGMPPVAAGPHFQPAICLPMSFGLPVATIAVVRPVSEYGVMMIFFPSIVLSLVPVAVTVTTPLASVATLETYLLVADDDSQPQLLTPGPVDPD